MVANPGWNTVELEVTTPLFSGGADQGGVDEFGSAADAGLRVASLRGAMRFWFRALAGTVAGDRLALLAGMEQAVFGSAQKISPVKLRIRNQPKISRERQPAFIAAPGESTAKNRPPGHAHQSTGTRGGRAARDDGKWVIYLLGQGLADAGARELRRDFIEPSSRRVGLDIRLSGDDAVDTLALAALWLLCAYGGVGSRVRRGFGGLAITGVTGDLPGDWSPESLLTPGLSHYEGLTCLWPEDRMSFWQTCLTQLPDVDVPEPEGDEAWAGRPTYPVLSTQWAPAALRPGNTAPTWIRVLGYAGEQYRWFRARHDTPGVRYRPQIKTTEWGNVTGRGDDRFALGALGLPIVFKNPGPTVHADHHERGRAVPLRRPSPLWLRAVSDGRQQWKLFSYAFQAEFLPPSAAVHVWPTSSKQGGRLQVNDNDLTEQTSSWISGMRDGTSFIRNRDLQ